MVTVAPRAGAWIEAPQVAKLLSRSVSLPVRERGLKLTVFEKNALALRSLPVRERGLKRCMMGIRCGYNGRSPCGSVD